MKFKNSPQYLLATMLLFASHADLHGRKQPKHRYHRNPTNPTVFQNSTNESILLQIMNKKNQIAVSKKIKPYEVISMFLRKNTSSVLVNGVNHQINQNQSFYKLT